MITYQINEILISAFRYVLDGFPCTKKQVELMNERKILPVKIIELDVEDKELKRRAAMDRRSKERFVNTTFLPIVIFYK